MTSTELIKRYVTEANQKIRNAAEVADRNNVNDGVVSAELYNAAQQLVNVLVKMELKIADKKTAEGVNEKRIPTSLQPGYIITHDRARVPKE